VNIQVEVFWVVTPCSDAVRCQRLEGPRCLHLQGEFYTVSQPRKPRFGIWSELSSNF